MTALERLLKYIALDTASTTTAESTPSSVGQFDLAHLLAKEMRSLGFESVRVSEDCFVYGHLSATPGLEHLPCLGLLAHMDTSPDFNGANVKPQIIPNYDGGDVLLAGTGDILSPNRFPDLLTLKGKTLVTTDGTSLLGGDDKAGIAEILTACEALLTRNIPHGRIAVAFTPDEELGTGIAHFDLEGFGADYAYTLDGGALGEVSYENFNACEATATFRGVSVHPGSAKGTMRNASLLALVFATMMPYAETPGYTSGYQGFFHLEKMEGSVDRATLLYLIRDHDEQRFESRKEQMRHIARVLNERCGDGTVSLELRDQYRNMKELILPHFHLIEDARKAMRAAGFEPFEKAVRGGTDGAQLCYRGLPCPNLCTGTHACHGPFEHLAVEDMDACVEMLLHLIQGQEARS